MRWLDSRIVLAALVSLAAGCQTEQPKKASVLQSTQMSPDAVALEILLVRLPPKSAELHRKVWGEVDEQHLPAELRQLLARNGFRAGVLGQMPSALADVLAMQDKAPAAGEPQKLGLADFEGPPRVMPRLLQTRAGQRNEIVASGVYDDLPVLLSEDGELCGRTFHEAQGIFALAAFPQADGRVRLELVPELHHDQSRPHVVGDQGMWRLECGRPKRVFDDLKIPALLTPGSILIVGCLPDRPGSLGHSFFTEDSGSAECAQKLLLVRVCQTQHDDLVHPLPLTIEP
jgi:hypothetical protein